MSVSAVRNDWVSQLVASDNALWVQKEGIFLSAPNGQLVKVTRSQHEKIGDDVEREDSRDLVITAGSAERESYSETEGGVDLLKYEGCEFAWRACDGIDYASYGYAKWGRYWYDPANDTHIAHITRMQESELERTWSRSALQGPLSVIKMVMTYIGL